MRLATITLMASTGIAAAHIMARDEPYCEAQYIVDTCVANYQPQIEACEGNDWICLCDIYTNLQTCYNNCPKSNDKPPVDNQVIQFCAAAAPLKSASSQAAATVKTKAISQSSESKVSATATSSREAADAAETGFGTGHGTGTATESSTAAAKIAASKTGAASALTVPAGGALAALLGLAGLL